MGVLKIMGQSGDRVVEWDATALETQDPTGLESLKEAERIVEEYQEKGVPIFQIASRGQKAQRATSFNPNAEEIIIGVPLAGG